MFTKIKAWTDIEHTQTCWTCWTWQNMLKHAATPWPYFSKPLFKKWGQGAAACSPPVLQRSEHDSPCSVFFNVLNIEHVQIFFFMFKKRFNVCSCSHVQHVLSLFGACSQSLNMLNMQLTVKIDPTCCLQCAWTIIMSACGQGHCHGWWNYYPGGKCDSRPGADNGSSVWYTCPWTMDWSEYD